MSVMTSIRIYTHLPHNICKVEKEKKNVLIPKTKIYAHH